jgi:pre-mycofactocin synthase
MAKWFETVAEAQRRAKKRLPGPVYSALLAGSEKGVTYDDNLAAFSQIEFAPTIANLHQNRDQSTRVMGIDIGMPVMISPTGVQAVHPEGEVAVARAAAARGTIMGLSSFASKPVEAVVEANPNTLFQVYWTGTREVMLQRIERARAAGAKGLIVTLDWTFSHGRDWGSPKIPERLTLKAAIEFAPIALMRPAWLATFLKTFSIPDLTAPNLTPPGGKAPTFFGAYGEWMQTAPPSWKDIEWLAGQWNGQLMVKGVSRVADAKAAVNAGATAISVSNHGGNNLDTTPAAIRFLPTIAEAVGKKVDVVLDGGVRRGGDVVKALALGAKAVMIGRAYLWGLASGGQAGVENVLDIMRGGIDSALLGLGKSSVAELSPADVYLPPNFTRSF